MTEATVITELKRHEIAVSMPFGDNERTTSSLSPTAAFGGCRSRRGISFRVEEPDQADPRIDRAEDYEFDRTWPP